MSYTVIIALFLIVASVQASVNTTLFVFFQTTDYQGNYIVFTGSQWTSPTPLSIGQSYAAGVTQVKNALHVYHQGYNNNGLLFGKKLDIEKWEPTDIQVPNVGLSYSPSALYNPATGRVHLFHKGASSDGNLWYVASPDGGATWKADENTHSGISFGPFATFYDNNLVVLHVGYAYTELWYRPAVDGRDGVTWGLDTKVLNVSIRSQPTAVDFRGVLYVFYKSAITSQLTYVTFNGLVWSAETKLAGTYVATSASVVHYKNQLWVFYDDSSFLKYVISGDGMNFNPPTTIPGVTMNSGPTAFVYNPLV